MDQFIAFRRIYGLVLCLVGVAGLAACAETGETVYRANPIDPSMYPRAGGPGEVKAVPPAEIEAAARITAIVETHLQRMYKTGLVRRDAHPKAHGCVKATFSVQPSLPTPLGRGLFKEAANYPAIIRFSNGNEDATRPDGDGDGRGMAIKVFDLPNEEPLVADVDDHNLLVQRHDTTSHTSQDFIMISNPTFLVGAPGDYQSLIGYADADNRNTAFFMPLLTVFSIGWKGTMNAIEINSKKIDNPLHSRYWSMVAYQLGTGPDAIAVKYSAAPCTHSDPDAHDANDPNFLRHVMAKSLAEKPACMKFLVQERHPNMSVEDPRYEWPESEAPFVEVARMTIPVQTFDEPASNEACERLSYNPWHALPEHRPLGAVNRMRRVIYERISAFRLDSGGHQPASG